MFVCQCVTLLSFVDDLLIMGTTKMIWRSWRISYPWYCLLMISKRQRTFLEKSYLRTWLYSSYPGEANSKDSGWAGRYWKPKSKNFMRCLQRFKHKWRYAAESLFQYNIWPAGFDMCNRDYPFDSMNQISSNCEDWINICSIAIDDNLSRLTFHTYPRLTVLTV